MAEWYEVKSQASAPVNGSKQVILEDGKIRFMGFNGTVWSCDSECDYNDLAAYTHTHTHGGTIEGDADTLDGKHASEIVPALIVGGKLLLY